MSKLSYPYFDFLGSRRSLDEFFTTYNKGKTETRDKLRSNHYRLCMALFEQYRAYIFKHCQDLRGTSLLEIDTERSPHLFTNRVTLAGKLKCHPNTVYNGLNFLLKAGILLEKIHHGSRRDFELVLNMELFTLRDRNNDISPFERAEIEKSKTLKNQPFPEQQSQSLSPFIKNQIHIKNVNNGIAETGIETFEKEKDLFKNTGSDQIPEPADGHLTRATESSLKKYSPGRAEIEFFHLIESYVDNFLKYSLSILWPQRVIYPGERINARKQILKIYQPAKNEKQLEIWDKQYRMRILMAKKYLEKSAAPTLKKPNPRDRIAFLAYPAKYFDPDYSNGFSGTKSWYQKHKAGYLLRSDKRNLNRAIESYRKDPGNINNYVNSKNMVLKNCPAFLEEFEAAISPGE